MNTLTTRAQLKCFGCEATMDMWVSWRPTFPTGWEPELDTVKLKREGWSRVGYAWCCVVCSNK